MSKQRGDGPQSIISGPRFEGRAVTVKEFAQTLGVDRKTVYHAIERGELPVVRLGRAIRIVSRQ